MCRWAIHVTQGVENYVSSPQEGQIQDPQDDYLDRLAQRLASATVPGKTLERPRK